MKTYEVFLNRIHKSSPYNCSGYIQEIKGENEDVISEHPEVKKLINETYGKKFILQVCPKNETHFFQYEITKSKAQ